MTRTRGRIGRIAILVAVTTALATFGTTPASAAVGTRGKMFQATNASRADHSVRTVRIHWQMSRLARRHSIAMARKRTLFHTANPASVYLKGVRWTTWGENVGYTDGWVSGLQQAFMASPRHRANILHRGFRRVAVGTYRDAGGRLWVTVFFYA
jgi:uncharacterized protein YkwD